jgi:hypothetical protein
MELLSVQCWQHRCSLGQLNLTGISKDKNKVLEIKATHQRIGTRKAHGMMAMGQWHFQATMILSIPHCANQRCNSGCLYMAQIFHIECDILTEDKEPVFVTVIGYS